MKQWPTPRSTAKTMVFFDLSTRSSNRTGCLNITNSRLGLHGRPMKTLAEPRNTMIWQSCFRSGMHMGATANWSMVSPTSDSREVMCTSNLKKSLNHHLRLRALAAFLITNQLRNEVMNRPRHQRKRIVLEEIGGLLTIPNGGQIVTEFYQRMRKYRTWVISVMQQTEVLKDSPAVASSVLGNARIGIFLRQEISEELEYLSKSFPLPDSTRESILRFNIPTRELGAPFVYYHKGTKPIIATARHILSNPDPSSKVLTKNTAIVGQSASV